MSAYAEMDFGVVPKRDRVSPTTSQLNDYSSLYTKVNFDEMKIIENIKTKQKKKQNKTKHKRHLHTQVFSTK